jgi:hypothetical protein
MLLGPTPEISDRHWRLSFRVKTVDILLQTRVPQTAEPSPGKILQLWASAKSLLIGINSPHLSTCTFLYTLFAWLMSQPGSRGQAFGRIPARRMLVAGYVVLGGRRTVIADPTHYPPTSSHINNLTFALTGRALLEFIPRRKHQTLSMEPTTGVICLM